jgi:hypothetical protein
MGIIQGSAAAPEIVRPPGARQTHDASVYRNRAGVAVSRSALSLIPRRHASSHGYTRSNKPASNRPTTRYTIVAMP